MPKNLGGRDPGHIALSKNFKAIMTGLSWEHAGQIWSL